MTTLRRDRKRNWILKTDAYKHVHWALLPPGLRHAMAYAEARGGEGDTTLWVGLQMLLCKEFEGVVIEQWMIEDAEVELGEVFMGHPHFNKAGWQRLLDKHKGVLPIRICALPEGTVIQKSNALMTVECLDDEFPWLQNWCESVLLHVWHPQNIATLCRQIYHTIKKYADLTSDAGVSPFHLNGFGFRAATCTDAADAEIGHLLSFQGTDTLVASEAARIFYDAPRGYGKSVAANEHFTVTSWGRENEFKAYDHALDTYPEGILSMVTDSYDHFRAVEYLGTVRREQILARGQRTGFAKLVIRPDSGFPLDISIKTMQMLDEYFGHTINSKGYKVLNPKVGIIYGDGINQQMIDKILEALTIHGYSSDSIVFGAGGEMIQKHNRDTHQMAFKCCLAEVDGVWVDVAKDPITSKGKRSKGGDLVVVDRDGAAVTVDRSEMLEGEVNRLVEVFNNGEITRFYNWSEVIANAAVL